MRRFFLFAVIALAMTGPGCRGSTMNSPDGGSVKGGSGGGGAGAGGGGAGGAGGGARADGPASTPSADGGVFIGAPTNCLGIRECIYKCAADASCAGRCVSTAPAAARTAYQAAATCSKKECPMQDPDCRCMAECVFPGACVDLVDECTAGIMDQFCEIECH